MLKEYISHSYKETEKIAEELANSLSGGEVIAFCGELGMGKTCFVRGLARGLGYNGNVSSPTFALINEYIGGRLNLYHSDMYRVNGWEDLYSTGYFDYINAGGVVAVEWSENITAALSDNTISVSIEQIDDNTRKISISGGDLF